MGVALVGIVHDRKVYGVMIEKAYLPQSGEARDNIFSTGRLWKKQGIFMEERDIDVLHVADLAVQFRRRNFSPVIDIVIPASGEAKRLLPFLVSSSTNVVAEHRLHLSGIGKHGSSKLGHMRLGHFHQDVTNARLGLKCSRLWHCFVCRLFKAKAPILTPVQLKTVSTEVPSEATQLVSETIADSDSGKKLGECVHFDVFGPYKVRGETQPAAGTGWTHILGAFDAGMRVGEAMGCVEPTGVIVAKFVRAVHAVFSTVYKTKIECVRFDNASIFHCTEVLAVCVELQIRRTFTIPYMHHQLYIERYWSPMQRNAACMLALSQRPKSYYLHACLHAFKLLDVVLCNKGQTVCRRQQASGYSVDLNMYRVWGADMFGLITQEERKRLRFDKADPHALFGVYIGNDPRRKGWLMIADQKLHVVGAGIIDEVKLLRAAPHAHLETYDELFPFASTADEGQFYDGTTIEVMESTSTSSPPVVADATPSAQPAAPDPRPDRSIKPIIRFAPGEPNPKPVQSVGPKSNPKINTKVLVPAELWPRYLCEENDKKGWLAEITQSWDSHARLRFLNGKWPTVLLKHGSYIVLNDDKTSAPALNVSTLDGVRVLSLKDEQTLPRAELYSLACAFASTPNAPIEIDPSITEFDPHLGELALWTKEDAAEDILFAAHVSATPKVNKQIVKQNGKPTWVEVPNNVPRAKSLPTWPRWEGAMHKFLDTTENFDGAGFTTVSEAFRKQEEKDLSIQLPIGFVHWIFKYKDNDEHARLVFAYSAARTPFEDNSSCNVAAQVSWKSLIHLALTDGATLSRLDIKCAHQSVAAGPDTKPVYSYCPQGVHYTVDTPEGSERALFRWLGRLNGMPPVGREFYEDVHGVLTQYDTGFLRSTQDECCWLWQGKEPDTYIKIVSVVDDFLVASKNTDVSKLVTHLEKRWGIKQLPVDGWLNNQFYMNASLNTVTITMDQRLMETMMEFLPDELESSKWPPTPDHPHLKLLALEPCDDLTQYATSHRLLAKIIYMVYGVYYNCQYVCFYIGRYQHGPSPLYKECLLHLLRHMYGHRHIGLTLGKAGPLASGGSILTTSENLTTSFTDAGHAESGPSTGGHTIDIDGVTIQAYCRRHRATTLGTTLSETYELSRAVASIVSHRAWMVEMGHPQIRASTIKCDNSGSVKTAASKLSDREGLYIKRRKSFIQEAVASGEIEVVQIPSEDNKADILTKVLGTKLYKRLRDVLLNVQNAAAHIATQAAHTLQWVLGRA